MEEEIKKSIIEFIDKEGFDYLEELKKKHGTIWIVYREGPILVSTHSTIGRQIRNHIIDKFPEYSKSFESYGDFEDRVAELVDNMF